MLGPMRSADGIAGLDDSEGEDATTVGTCNGTRKENRPTKWVVMEETDRGHRTILGMPTAP